MSHYDHEGMTPPTFDHRIHSELCARECRRLEDPDRPETPREGEDVETAAMRRVDERHGTPGPPNRRGPPLKVRPEELDDLPRAVRVRIARRDDGSPRVHGGGSTIRARCPNCGRHEQSWALFDLRHIKGPLRDRLTDHAERMPGGAQPGDGPGTLPPYACHACVSAWIRSGLVTKAEWLEAHGGPRELIEHFRANPDKNTSP